jgi:hypothetical protein
LPSLFLSPLISVMQSLSLTLSPLIGVYLSKTRGGAVEARRAHNPKVVGSNPTPATKPLTEVPSHKHQVSMTSPQERYHLLLHSTD